MKTQKTAPHTPIAIVGIGCMFAQSPDAKGFFHLLTRGINAIADPPETHRHLLDYYDPDPKKPDHIYCNRGGYLPKIDFDPTEFGIPPSSLEATDTSQLLSLLVAKQALADAGYGDNGQDFDRSKTSIILGVTGTQELVIPLGARLGHPVWRRALADSGVPDATAQEVIERISDGFVSWQENSFPGLLGNVVAGRIANRLDLGGTNCVVDAACASSMSAIHLAVLELSTGRSDMVLAGGADTINDAFMHMCFSKTQILSKSGEIRPFSQDADGTVLGEGIGIVVLKRLADAQKDNDRVYAVIKGLGSASDGKSQSIYAPRPAGQALALRRAYAQAGIEPSTVDLVEAHGTGTRVGDQVEFQALCDVFGELSSNGNRCALGTVKSNIGHTKAAAGTAGLIKTAMALYHKVLPPTLKAAPTDPKLNVDHSPFYINHNLRPWAAPDGHVRRAGVSAFGFGGSNFHTVLEEYSPEKQEPSWDGSVELAAFSGSTRQSLTEQVRKFLQLVSDDTRHQQIAHRCAQTRRNFRSADEYRLVMMLTPDDPGQLAQTCDVALQRIGDRQLPKQPTDSVFFASGKPEGSVAFLFPGQGSQYVGMARDLVCWLPAGLEAYQEAEKHLTDEPLTLSEYLYPRLNGDAAEFEQRLRQTSVAQPAIGAASVALLEALTYFGIRPAATCGHSYGELPALYAAGWIDRESLWKLSVARGRFMADAGNGKNDAGTMLAVSAPVNELQKLANDMDGVVLANRNSPSQGVLSGACAAIDQAEKACRDKGWKTIRLAVAAAFHSTLVADAQTPFGKVVDTIHVTPTPIDVMSNTTGSAYPKNAQEARALLGGQLAQPVDFISNIENLYANGVRTFVEVGPKSVLTRLVSAILEGRHFEALAMDSSAGRSPGLSDLARVVAHLATNGYPVELERWENALSEPRALKMRIPLSGANYRSAAPSRPKSPPMQMKSSVAETNTGEKASDLPAKPPIRQAQAPDVRASTPPASTMTTPQQPEPLTSGKKHVTMDYTNKNYLTQALTAVQQGLSSMQALQAQTTQAHQKYLDAQAEASRTLQQMMHSTQQMTSAILSGTPMESLASPPVAAPQRVAETAYVAPQVQPQVRPSNVPAPSATHTEITPVVHELPTSGKTTTPATEPVRNALLQIVSQLTGYPEQMLGLEMDIESDLGIDSIKRVEILSALEDKMPDLPKVTPDMVGTLKTLGQILDYLCEGSAANQAVAHSAVAGAPVGQSLPNSAVTTEVQSALVQIVSELTGYPEQMLGLEMDIESDLGIDSIKRVEILSALEDKMPDLPKVTPDMVGTLKTLGQICGYLCQGAGILEISPVQAVTHCTAACSAGRERIQSTLVSIVSELTGYPEEMLGLEMDIESDLGIDSIKRVEILSALEEKMPELPKVTPDMVGTLKTLGQICDYLDSDEQVPVEPVAVSPETTSVGTAETDNSASQSIGRSEIHLVPVPQRSTKRFAPAKDHAIGIVCPDDQAVHPLIAALTKSGYLVERLTAPEQIDGGKLLAGLVLLSPMAPVEAFRWARACAANLEKAARKGHALFFTVSRLDGAFGFSGSSIDAPEQGAMAGLAKTAALEWPAVHCKAIDINPAWTDVVAATRMLADEIQLYAEDGFHEIGLDAEGPKTLQMIATGLPEPAALELTTKDAVVVSGGARGVTAAAVKALAENVSCRFALLGRSPQPRTEPEWLKELTDEARIKKAILANSDDKTTLTPKDLERVYRRWMANREINDTLNQLGSKGIQADYYSVDVCDTHAMQNVIARIRQQGPIKGLIHGAGILEDRLITDKKTKQFQSVYDTKVKGLSELLMATQQDDLRHIVLFSSVSARMGNYGQVDYAMANEVINKTAVQLAHERPDCKVVSINWGPWDGGMVTPALKRNFKNNGISLIPVQAGATAMVAEMGVTRNGNGVEVVIGGPVHEADARNGVKDSPAEIEQIKSESLQRALVQAAKRDIDETHCPVLKSHQLDGRPVVPFALIAEWLAHSALHANPGLVLHGIDHLRLLKGIALDVPKRTIRLMAGAASRNNGVYEVDVEIRDDGHNGSGLVHSSAKAILADRLPAPPSFKENGHFKSTKELPSLGDIYGRILFHGDDLKGIKNIIRLSKKGMTAELLSAPSPEQWIEDPMRSRWIADPLVLDCAFQMAIIWCHEQMGLVSLPSYAASYRQYCDRFPSQGITAVLEVVKATDRKMVADFTFLDKNKKIIAQMSGYEAVMDKGLFKAFGVKAA